MDCRHLGTSGLKVPVLSFGAGTFGGSGPLFGAWDNSEDDEARPLLDICLESGVNLFDTDDVYSNGASETVLGEAIKGRRSAVLLSTKLGLPMGSGPNDAGTSRMRIISAVEDALIRLAYGPRPPQRQCPLHVVRVSKANFAFPPSLDIAEFAYEHLQRLRTRNALSENLGCVGMRPKPLRAVETDLILVGRRQDQGFG